MLEAEKRGTRTLWESQSAAVEEAGYRGVEKSADEVGV